MNETNKIRLKIAVCQALVIGVAASVHAQLTVTVSPPKVAGQKAVVPLAMKNSFAEKIESARAVCFLSDAQGKVVGQATQWVIGGTKERPSLETGGTNAFFFVIQCEKPVATTNLTTKVSFTRLVLAGGKSVDPAKMVQILEPPGAQPQKQ